MEVETILSNIIQIPSVNPPGNETGVASYLAHLFADHGIPYQIVEPKTGRTNFIARLGNGPRRLLFLSHSDVVPPGEGWDFDPFSGQIDGGFLLGRGAQDCKGLLAAECWAMLRLAQEPPISGSLILAAVADEENGGRWGMEWLAHHAAELIAADWAINEGGEPPLILNRQPVGFIQVGEKGVAQTALRTTGVSCHGSLPTLGENAVLKMGRVLRRLDDYQPPVYLLPEVEAMVQRIAGLLGGPPAGPGQLDQLLEQLPDRIFREYLRSVTRMTVSPNVIHGGTRVNVVPDTCRAEVDIRVLPGQDLDYVAAELVPLVTPEATMETMDYHPPSFSPVDHPGFRLLAETLHRLVGTGTVLPCLSTGATDSRFLRGLGIPAYGIAVLHQGAAPELRAGMHGRNEKIDCASLQLVADLLLEAARQYLK